MLRTILALKAWAVYRIAKMVNLSVITARLVSLRKLVLVKKGFNIMLNKMGWFMLYSFRGLIRVLPILLLSMVLTLINSRLQSVTDAGSLVYLLIYISNGLTIAALGALVFAALVWIDTWITDYRSDYLPNWIRKDLY